MSTIPRFFVPPEAIVGETVVLPPDVLHHARNVLRLRPGEPLILHDGQGFAYEATFPEGKNATAIIVGRVALETEPALRATIAQALPKTSDKVEQVLQHGTEIGAAGFIFFQSERSVARMEARDKIEKRLERWADIVKGAAEQSRRGVLPTVLWEPRLTGILARLPQFTMRLLLHESATVPLHTVLTETPPETNGSVLLLVGPEGGFSDNEVAQMVQAGATSVHLGPRILRTETAALVGLAQLLYTIG